MLCRHVVDKISSKFCGILHVLVNFTGFRRSVTWILQIRTKYQKPWYYEPRLLHYINWWLKICIWRLYFSSWSPKGGAVRDQHYFRPTFTSVLFYFYNNKRAFAQYNVTFFFKKKSLYQNTISQKKQPLSTISHNL